MSDAKHGPLSSEGAVGITTASDVKNLKSAQGSISSKSLESHNFGSGAVFAEGTHLQYHEPIAEYEGRHRYDPTAQWTEAEEKKLVRKVCASTHPSHCPPGYPTSVRKYSVELYGCCHMAMDSSHLLLKLIPQRTRGLHDVPR